STYNDADNNAENGTIDDNKSGNWLFINTYNVVKVPFYKGYYAEFKVKDLSEFWLNNGGVDQNAHLAIQLIDFTAQRSGSRNALLNWKMGSEEKIVRYEIEMAKDKAAMQSGQFIKIGQSAATGSASFIAYNFTDSDPDKFDTVYYRLKIVYNDGKFSYSGVRPVIFDDAVPWTLYPNPSRGRFYLDFQGDINEPMVVNLFDAKGSLIKSFTKQSNGFMQKVEIDLSAGVYANGIYLLKVSVGGKVNTFKLYKQ
ncbi:MAG: T9SS type A sorting domain-containing protein, partial [Chitinophagaceae bacterium]